MRVRAFFTTLRRTLLRNRRDRELDEEIRFHLGLVTVSWVAEDGAIQAHNHYRVYSYFRDHSATVRPLAAFDFQRVTLSRTNGSYAVLAGLGKRR